MGKKSQNQKPAPTTQGIKIIHKNKKAYYEYEILDKYECGIMLLGSEVKSIRDNKLQFSDSHAKIKNKELCIFNLRIANYKFDTGEPIDPLRIRKLLLHKQELKKIKRQIEEKGLAILPLSIYLKNGLVKLEIGVGRGKKLHDKKNIIMQRTLDREAQKEIKSRFRN